MHTAATYRLTTLSCFVGIFVQAIMVNLTAILCYLAVALSPWNALSLAACILSGFAASLLWLGTLITASERYPLSGAWMFALLAAAGDVGAPTSTRQHNSHYGATVFQFWFPILTP